MKRILLKYFYTKQRELCDVAPVGLVVWKIKTNIRQCKTQEQLDGTIGMMFLFMSRYTAEDRATYMEGMKVMAIKKQDELTPKNVRK